MKPGVLLPGGRAAAVATAATGLLSGAAGVLMGVDGAVAGALVATALVLLFFWTGSVPLLLLGGDTSRAGLGLLVLLMTYGLRVVGLVVVMSVAAASGAVDVRWTALTVIACTIVWVGAAAGLSGSSAPDL